MSPKILRQSPSGESFSGNPGDVLTCLGGDVWEAEPGGGSTGFTPRGTGAQFKTFFSTDQNLVYVTDFMTDAEQADCFDGSLTLDLQPAIQRAIDYALYRDSTGTSGGPRVRLPAGLLRLDRPIQMGYGIDLRSLVLEGEGTNLEHQTDLALVIAVQGMWFGQLQNFSIFAPGASYVFNSVINNVTMANLDVATWIAPLFPASASTRFAVQCGIAIDPYSGPQPAVHYPAVVYPSFLGAVAQYNKQFSSNVKVSNVYIEGCVAGIALQPCDADGNGDFMRFDNVSLFFCPWGFVWGNSQARVTTLDSFSFLGNHTSIDNITFGQTHGGNPQLIVKGASFNEVIRWANLDTQNGQGPLFLQCFCEASYSLGNFGINAEKSGSTQFDNCEFGFSWWSLYGVPLYTATNGGRVSMLRFRQCYFFENYHLVADGGWGGLSFSGVGVGGQTESAIVFAFEDCWTTFDLEPTQLWEKCALNATVGMNIRLLSTAVSEYGWRINRRYDLDTGANANSALYGTKNTGNRSLCLPVYGALAKSLPFGNDPGVPLLTRLNGYTAAGAITQVGRNITFTVTGLTSDLLARIGGDVGDVISSDATGINFWVYSRTGTTISARAQSGYDLNGNLLTALPNADFFWSLNCRRYCPSVVMYGDITSGSAIITNVVDGSGAAFTIANQLTVGDWFFQDPEVNKIFPTDAATKIAAIDDLLHTITLGGNALQTLTHQRLGLWVRTAMPNGTATP